MAGGTVATWVVEEAIRVHTAAGVGAGWHRCRAVVGVGTVAVRAEVGTTGKGVTTGEEGLRMEVNMAWAAEGRGKTCVHIHYKIYITHNSDSYS